MKGSMFSRLNWVVAAMGAVLMSVNAYAQVQQVTGTPATQTAASGASVEVQALYSVDGSKELTGLGLRTHWDSTKLDFVNVVDFEAFGFEASNTFCQNDTTVDYDNDPATDCYIGTAWVRAEEDDQPVMDWPGDPLPRSLLTMNFTSLLDEGESTKVNFSDSSTAAGYSFAGTSAVVNGAGIPGLCGDANDDGAVNIIDALAVARYVAELPPPPAVNTANADVDGNGSVDIVDALLMARYVAELAVPGTCLE